MSGARLSQYTVTTILLLGALLPASAYADILHDVDQSVLSENAAGGNGYAVGQGLGTGLTGILTSATMNVHAETPFSPCLTYTLNEYDAPNYGNQNFRTNHWYSTPLFCGSGTHDGLFTASFPSVQLDPTKYYLLGPDAQSYTGWSAIQLYGDATTTYNSQPVGSFDSNGFIGAHWPDNQIKSAWFSLAGVSTTSPQPTTTPSGPSSVLFLPGIESSRLYEGAGQLWEPGASTPIGNLILQPDGSDLGHNIYTKDVIDEAYAPTAGPNIYKSFLHEMSVLADDQRIAAFEAIPYDWRLSLQDNIDYGHKIGDQIYYSGDNRATSTPYLVQEFNHLKDISPAKKVTVIAHSNGGLLLKQLLISHPELNQYIDKIIFVDVPQVGTPQAIGGLLHGYKQGIPADIAPLFLSPKEARTIANNFPSLYNLLPSQGYFTYIDDPAVTFDSSTLPDYVSRYGDTVHSTDRLNAFLNDSYQKVSPDSSDLSYPASTNATMLSDAQTLHTSLDAWEPASTTELIQIAGWGIPTTLRGIEYYKKQVCLTAGLSCIPTMVFAYEASTTIDGDGTVVTPSQLWTSHLLPNVKNYWVDLRQYNTDHLILSAGGPGGLLATKHADVTEVPSLLQFLSDTVASTTSSRIYQYLSDTVPSSSNVHRLRYALHSPLTLNLYDDQGRHTGISTTTGFVEEQIPGTYYMEFGDVKYIFSDATTPTHLIMNGYDNGVFTLNVDEFSGDTKTASTTFKNIPTTSSTVAELSASSDIASVSSLAVDEDGDGTYDYELQPKLNDVTTLPKPILSIVPDDRVIELNSPIPALGAHLSGFVNGDMATSSTTGEAACSTNAAQGSPVGTYTITCSKGTLASDTYDFNSEATGTLRIIYRFDGFLQPINDTAHQIGVGQSVFKAGSTVPVKLQLKDAQGNPVQSATPPVWQTPVRGASMNASVGESVYTDPETTGNIFKWDDSLRGYIYNWKTKNYPKGYWYTISALLPDDKAYTVVIGLK